MIDPIQLADKGARLTGELPLKEMTRLAKMCANDSGSVHFDLAFERELSSGLRSMHGFCAARVQLICQRCMGRMAMDLESPTRVLLLQPGEREDLLEAGDAIAIEQPVALSALIEDELLLQMPMVPTHPANCCPAQLARREPREKQSSRPNPFSMLEKLKRSDR